MRLLIVEDDPQIVDGLTRALSRLGHNVEALGDGVAANLRLITEEFDLVILDLGLPGMDGFEILRNLRDRGKQTPILLLTAKDELDDRIHGLNLGADDYVVKPFELGELEARIRAIVRRARGRSGGDLVVGGLRLKLLERTVILDGAPIILSPREFGLLECLMLRHERVVSKSLLQDHLSDGASEVTEGAIEIYVHRLRRKIEFANVEVRTIRGFGYMLRPVPNAA